MTVRTVGPLASDAHNGVLTPPIEIVVTGSVDIPAVMLDEVRAIDPRLRVHTVSPEQRPFLQAGRGSDAAPEARALRELLARTQIVLAAVHAPTDLVERAPKLRWLHSFHAGVEEYMEAGFLESGIAITKGSGPTAIPVAEYILMAVLTFAKKTATYIRQQGEHHWERSNGFELRGKTVGIIGLGQVGAEAAGLLKAVGCRVIASRRSCAEPREDTAGVDLLLPPRDLPRLLKESDFVAVCAPATPETTPLIDAAALRQMKRSAYLINVARGPLVDETALVEALKRGEIAGAALDVFEPEPLSPASDLWDLKQVLITPHVANASEHYLRRQVDLFVDNLRRYLRGDSLRNLVTRERGY